jgi:hypothetical protein
MSFQTTSSPLLPLCHIQCISTSYNSKVLGTHIHTRTHARTHRHVYKCTHTSHTHTSHITHHTSHITHSHTHTRQATRCWCPPCCVWMGPHCWVTTKHYKTRGGVQKAGCQLLDLPYSSQCCDSHRFVCQLCVCIGLCACACVCVYV